MIRLSQFIREAVEEDELTRRDLNQVERVANSWFDKYGIDVKFTRHFLDRVNDERNGKQITKNELIDLFKRLALQYGDNISKNKIEIEAVAVDLFSDINIPMVLKNDEIVSKTVMRKKDFRTTSKKMPLR